MLKNPTPQLRKLTKIMLHSSRYIITKVFPWCLLLKHQIFQELASMSLDGEKLGVKENDSGSERASP